MIDQSGTDNEKHLTLEEELGFLQKIIDQQNNIIVVSNGRELTMVNHQFLDFFAQPSLNAFKSEFGDISNAFVQHERYFHLGKVESGMNWIASLKAKKDTESIVSMIHLGEYEPKAFAVKISGIDDGELLYVLTFTDITSFAIQSNQYFYKSTHDGLTGIYNLAYFSDTLAEMLEEVPETPLSMIMFSLDDFKAFTEVYGHKKGDEVVKDMVDMVTMHLRDQDLFARLGRKVFALLLPNKEFEDASRLAQKLCNEIGEMETYVDMKVSASFGVGLYDGSLPAEGFLNYLETLLYEAKATGKNRVATG